MSTNSRSRSRSASASAATPNKKAKTTPATTAVAAASTATAVGSPAGPSSPTRLYWRLDPDQSFSDWTILIREEHEEEDLSGGDAGKEGKPHQRRTKKYHVHRNVLALNPNRCGYFATLLLGQQTFSESDTRTTTLDLPPFAFDAFDWFLDFLYGGGGELSLPNPLPLADGDNDDDSDSDDDTGSNNSDSDSENSDDGSTRSGSSEPAVVVSAVDAVVPLLYLADRFDCPALRKNVLAYAKKELRRLDGTQSEFVQKFITLWNHTTSFHYDDGMNEVLSDWIDWQFRDFAHYCNLVFPGGQLPRMVSSTDADFWVNAFDRAVRDGGLQGLLGDLAYRLCTNLNPAPTKSQFEKITRVVPDMTFLEWECAIGLLEMEEKILNGGDDS